LSETKSLAKLTNEQISKFLDGFADRRSSDVDCSYIEELKLYLVKEKTL